ncbi:MAG: hypothetical protein KBA67_00530 [Leptotrichiaceae bacterium]|nr:hypothetical protein [Leptotrichiaceae bacterium]MBP6281272.1 hypothetical protein [Leptotrichiaceae bacterium]MBP7100006.1 hypothetical protein [Leptotrichiaceae bacterium]MBP7725048.1 hypothetical protein [Leptotrichiaceae bacterium]MBP9629479.1 hypothetical protein [Leptotrichiaceae bacterium]
MKKYLMLILIFIICGFSILGSESRKSNNKIDKLQKIRKLDYKNFKYSETILSEEVKRKWDLSCEDLDCKIEYFRRDIPNKKEFYYEKIVSIQNNKEKDKIIKNIVKGMNNLQKGTAVTTIISWESVLMLENGKAYYGNGQNQEFYIVINNLLGENYDEIEEEIEGKIYRK